MTAQTLFSFRDIVFFSDFFFSKFSKNLNLKDITFEIPNPEVGVLSYYSQELQILPPNLTAQLLFFLSRYHSKV